MCLAAALGVSLWSSWALAIEPEREARAPLLTLPGSHVVRAGQWIDLRWSAADSVRELEILVSTDGGRSYPRWISPQLDPERRQFLWRVPDFGASEIRLRIRYNRAGREIECAPTVPIAVVRADGTAEPLILPPLPAESSPDPNGRGGSSSGSSLGPFETSEDSDDGDPAHSVRDPLHHFPVHSDRRASPTAVRFAAPTAPLFVPMRT